MNYRELILELLNKVDDEQILRRTYKLLEFLYIFQKENECQ